MLVGFNVGNYLSIKEMQRFSMVAGDHEELPGHICNVEGLGLLRGSFIYGSNASGKSNFIRAFKYSREMILDERRPKQEKSIPQSYRGKDDNYSTSPCYFEYNIYTSGEFYSYGIEIDPMTERIVGEWLYQMIDGTEDMIYSIDRNEGGTSKIAFPSMDHILKEYIESDDSRSFLTYVSSFKERDNEEIRQVHRWFKQSLVILSSENKEISILNRKEFLDRLVFYLKHLDTGIVGYERNRVDEIKKRSEYNRNRPSGSKDPYVFINDETSSDGSKKKVRIPDEYSEFDQDTIDKIVKTVNEGRRCILYSNEDMFEFYKDETGVICDEISFLHGKRSFPVKFKDESQGTRRLIQMLSMFEMTSPLDGPSSEDELADRTLIIDELECSIHTLATLDLIRIFYNRPESERSQLIATTHESRLLNQELIRKDEVWFVDVPEDGGERASSLYSLESFDDPDESFIDIAYLEGKYGGIPFLRTLDDQEDDY